MRLIEIRSSTNSYPKTASRIDCAGATCTYAEEIQNFANWFQYYRKRHLSLNGAIGNSLDGLNALRARLLPVQQPGQRHDVRLRHHRQLHQERAPAARPYLPAPRATAARRRASRSTGWAGSISAPTPASRSRRVPVQRRLHHHRRLRHQRRPERPTATTTPATAGAEGSDRRGLHRPDDGLPLNPRAGDAGYFNQQLGAGIGPAGPDRKRRDRAVPDNWSNTMADMAMKYYTRTRGPTSSERAGWPST